MLTIELNTAIYCLNLLIQEKEEREVNLHRQVKLVKEGWTLTVHAYKQLIYVHT